MKTILTTLLLLTMLPLAGCDRSGQPSSAADQPMRTVNDIRHRKIGVLLGSVYDGYAKRNYPQATILHYQAVSDLLIALTSGKIDVVFCDQSGVPDILKTTPELGILAKDIFTIPIGAGFNRDEDSLREQFNAFLRQIRADGTYADMVRRWIEEGAMEMPEINTPNINGVLRAGVVNDLGMPFGFIKDGRLIGFDIELSARFAAYTGRDYQPVPLQFGSLIASISTKKIDIITASMFITDERKKSVDFGDPYYESGVTLLARKDRIATGKEAPASSAEPGNKSLIKRIAEGFYNNIVLENRYRLILDGLKLTFVISLSAALLGTLLGGFVCFMRMSGNAVLSRMAAIYISLLRGTPVLVLLMIIYYVVFASVNIHPAVVAVIAFGMNFGAYVSEMFRAAILSVDRGQKEAGIAIGFTTVQTFIVIILPQALRQLLPVYKGEFISLVKMTSIVGYIAVQDLTKASDIIRSRTFDAFFPLVMAAVLYLLMAWFFTWALGRIEVSAGPNPKGARR